jgi:hypothetical protein
MANDLTDLRPIGSSLLFGADSFLSDLSEEDESVISGGRGSNSNRSRRRRRRQRRPARSVSRT